jgi:uncharacterized protein (DUF1800 family)
MYAVLLTSLLSAASAFGATVDIAPRTATLRPGVQQRFTSYVGMTQNKSVKWSVNGIVGGNNTLGTVAADGLYTAPAAPPGIPVTVTVTSVADSSASASATVTLLNPVVALTTVSPATLTPGSFTVTLDGTGFVPGSIVYYGSTALATKFDSTRRLTASGTATLVTAGMVPIAVVNPDPGTSVSAPFAVSVAVAAPRVTARAAARFLEQTSWGPTPATIARVQQIGFSAYLDEQFDQPRSAYPEQPTTVTNLKPLQQQFVTHALTGPDQLRQRVAFALSQIFVVSGLKTFTPEMFVPWLNLLGTYALGDYGALLRAVSLSPTMGRYLDLAHSEKASSFAGSAPNENYARELMQLFTIGTHELRPDGEPKRDARGDLIPTYDQATVVEVARALTGWTYPTMPGATPQLRNPGYFIGELEAVPTLHDNNAKTMLDDSVLPAGQTPVQDLDGVLAALLRHPNVAPFVARRLIQQMVTSNPSPAYVARVASAFSSSTSGAFGDLKTTVRAIVLDSEARRGDSEGTQVPGDGHLREPVLFALSILRRLGASPTGVTQNVIGMSASAGQHLFYPPSVNNYFPLNYDLPGSDVRAPEFHILTPSTAVARANLALVATYAPQSFGVTTDLTSFVDLAAASPSMLVEAVNQALLSGRMSSGMRTSVEQAVAAASRTVPRTRVEAAVFLTASSAEFQVQQ